jgi:hypothetical protein
MICTISAINKAYFASRKSPFRKTAIGKSCCIGVFPTPPKGIFAPIKPFSAFFVFYFTKKFCQDFLLFILHKYAGIAVIKAFPEKSLHAQEAYSPTRGMNTKVPD